ncbi:hypothetical protein [Lentzea sp. NPDC051838]|uniref:non-homologous end-joining DNA ligase LigD n=1 Tax=Lentzea sp. NPDC051838 TaxID=3154849 RepID=UPI0034133561
MWIDPMLAKPDGGTLREATRWAYEYKLDGHCAAMRIAANGTTVLTNRNGLDLTAEFAELTGVLTAALRGRAAALDGEVVVYSKATRSTSANTARALAGTSSSGSSPVAKTACSTPPRAACAPTATRPSPSFRVPTNALPRNHRRSARHVESGRGVTVNAGGRTIVLSNLDRQVHPCGFTKGEVINYCSRIATLLLPRLRGWPVTMIRFPDRVGGQAFFQTRERAW